MAVAAGFRIIKKWGSSLSSHLENFVVVVYDNNNNNNR